MAQRFYRAIALQEPGQDQDAPWDVIFPEFPGCVTQGTTQLEALANATEALSGHVEAMVEKGLELPGVVQMDSPVPDWVTETPFGTQIWVFVPVDIAGRAVRLNITMDEALIGRLDAAAEAEGSTRSGYIAESVRERLRIRYGGLAEGNPMAATPRRKVRSRSHE